VRGSPQAFSNYFKHCDEVACWGRLFQARAAAATGNARSPMVERRRVWETINDDDAADRRRWQASKFNVR